MSCSTASTETRKLTNPFERYLTIWVALCIAGGILLASGLGGAGAGAWIGGMVGLTAGNTHLKAFEDAIEQGQMLVMLDVPRARVDEITERVRALHPQVQPHGADPDIPVFP